jgi:hypothetical protein
MEQTFVVRLKPPAHDTPRHTDYAPARMLHTERQPIQIQRCYDRVKIREQIIPRIQNT